MYLVERQHQKKKKIRNNFVLTAKVHIERTVDWESVNKLQVLFLIFLRIDFVAVSIPLFQNIPVSGQMRVMLPTTWEYLEVH